MKGSDAYRRAVMAHQKRIRLDETESNETVQGAQRAGIEKRLARLDEAVKTLQKMAEDVPRQPERRAAARARSGTNNREVLRLERAAYAPCVEAMGRKADASYALKTGLRVTAPLTAPGLAFGKLAVVHCRRG